MKKITSLVASVSALLLITSCSHEADFDSTAYVQQKKNEYAQNFVKRYGEIDPNQTWDFTSGATLSTTRAVAPHTQVYMQDLYGLDFTKSQNIAIYNAIKTQLPDNVEKTGKKAVLIAPGNPFVIYPLTTQGSWKHTLYVKVGNNGTWLYQKTWGNFDNPVCNGMRCDTCPGETKARCCYPAVREATRIIWKQFNQNLPSDEIICRKFERP